MVGIVSNSAALFAQRNLESANAQSESSIAKLSSGSRIIRAADDVSGLAVGTVLATTVNTLRTVLQSASQANSLLQIADGGLQNVSDLLQRQKALAVQANSGTLSDNERAFLNSEFQSLTSEINRLVDGTNFNGIQLLNGSIYDAVQMDIDENAGGFSGASITFAANDVADADTVAITFGTYTTTMTFRSAVNYATNNTATDVQAGATINESLNNLVAKLNALDPSIVGQTAATYYNYEIDGNNLQVTSKASGLLTTGETVTLAASGATTLTGESTGSLTGGNVDFTGTIGDNILNDKTGTLAQSTFAIDTSGGTSIADGQNIVIGGTTMTFRNATNYATNNTSTDVLIDGDGDTEATINATIDNLIGKLNALDDTQQASFFTYERVNDELVVTAKAYGFDDDATAAQAAAETNLFGVADFNALVTTTTAGALTAEGADFAAATAGLTRIDFSAATTLDEGSGIDVQGVSGNKDFAGVIQGFEATYVAGNTADISIQVGDITYTAENVSTNPAIDTVVRFTGQGGQGGYFDLVFNGGQGVTVANQADADVIANRLDAAFSTVSFTNRSTVASFDSGGDLYNGTTKIGTLNGASLERIAAIAGDLNITDIRVSASADPTVADAVIEIVTDTGDIYRSKAGIGRSAGNVYLENVNNPTDQIVFKAGAGGDGRGSIRLENPDDARILENALEKALGVGQGASGLNFQVGTTVTDAIGVSLQSAKTDNLYRDENGVSQTLDISTQAGAEAASDVLDRAINFVVALRAEVGALQSRFDFVSANVTSSIENTEAARSGFLDVDVASESTAFATAQVRLQASISVLAQANQLPQNLLKLIG